MTDTSADIETVSQMTGHPDDITVGVVIVAYGSEDVLPRCLESLAASTHEEIKIAVVDNASPDSSVLAVRRHAAARGLSPGNGFAEIRASEIPDGKGKPVPDLTLIRAGTNLGFGAGCNLGLDLLRQDPDIDLFWLLNPDTEVPPETASVYALKAASGPVGLMGGRVLFHAPPNRIQSDGGRLNRWTGFCRNVNFGKAPEAAEPPASRDIDFLLGANLVASRTFLDRVGPMREDYFLYYEEVDWALRRGDLPLALVPEAFILHHGGTVAGTGSLTGRASPLSNYYNYRNRMRFIARHNPAALPIAYAVSLWAAFGLLRAGAREEAAAAFRGLHAMQID
ncbi:glycosyltransferase family 2 protein [Hwanghaeella sp.]|uniref:glycosyltransferase family 2 protein n=1 Tax=Hwanghaeella sp. TaxID=2605943 RepID=UPI003CCB97BE